MRKVLILSGIIILIMASVGFALDGPHNESNDISCFDCHLGGQSAVDPNVVCLQCHTSSTGPYNKTSAPLVQTHSSATTSTKYGTWEKKCTDCHYFHFFNQHYTWGSATYLVTGTISSITDNGNGTITFGYTNLTVNNANWTDPATWGQKRGSERGLIMLPNTRDVSFGFEVLSATSTQITVKGSTAPFSRRMRVGDTFALIYGQAINAYIPNWTQAKVKFFDKTGENSFAQNDALAGDIDGDGNPDDSTPTGICQVCHTQTQHWRSDGSKAAIGVHSSQNGTDCMSCHSHGDGFNPAGACDSCHGYPPITASLGGPDGLVNSPDVTGSQTAGAHQKHATSTGLNYACTTCHTGYSMPETPETIDIGFNIFTYGGTNTKYNGQSSVTGGYRGNNGTTVTNTGAAGSGNLNCSNIYCHSIVQSNGGGALTPDTADYATPVWDDPNSVQCGSCHKADGVQGNATLMDSGSHTAHVSAPLSKGCNECHNGFGSGSSQHVNNEINMAFQTDPFSNTGSYSQSPNTPGNGYGSCSNIYCHSIVQTSTGGALTANTADYKNPSWGGTVQCGDCHAADGTQGTGTIMSSGSHTKHASTYGFACSVCHNGAGSATAKHADKNIDVIISSTYGASASYSQMPTNTPGNGFGSCSNVYCHSNGKVNDTGSTVGQYATPNWGTDNGTLTCKSCHGTSGTSQVGEPDYANAGAGAVDANSHSTHISSLGADTTSCNKCHSQTVDAAGNLDIVGGKHVNTLKDVVFADGGTYTAGTKSCSSTYCHGTGTPQWGGTVACGDCHDVNNSLAGRHSTHYASATNATTTDRTTAANNSTTANYVFSCAVCHNGVSHAGGKAGTNQVAEVAFDATVAGGGTYTAGTNVFTDQGSNGTGDFQYTDGTCSSVYCHSDGNGGTPNVSVNWAMAQGSLDCAGCHNYTAASGTPMASGKHSAHVGTATTPKYAFNCSKCHNATTTDGVTIADKTMHVNHTKDVAFDTLNSAGTFDSGTKACSSLYCHSDGNGGAPNVSVDWATATLPTDCTGCHNNNAAATPNTMASGSHTAHINKGTIMANKTCDTCHTSTVSGDRTIVDYVLHVNGTKDVTINATYDGDASPGNNYASGQCSDLYCHSKGTSLTGPYTAPNTAVTWGVTTNLSCSDCHDGPPTGPSYTNGTPKANSHAKHTGAPWNFGCVKCHDSTVDATNAIATPANHLNKTYDVSGADIGSYTYNASGGTCSTIACHGGNNAQWGATLSCADCHVGTGDVDDYTFNNGTTARLDSTEWTSTGHGLAATGTYNVSGNSGAGLTCEYCHDNTVAHGTATNPFRLANYNVGGNGWNDVCFVCHQTGSAGYDPDGAGPLALKNSTLKIDKYHYGAKHGATNDGGSLCFDCHDPHGDSNIYMVHASVTKDKADAYGTPASTASPVFTNNATGTDYAKSSAPYDGVCNVCHASTSHYTATSGDGHNSGSRCTTCHSHSGDTVINGEAFKPSGDCNTCHGYPPTPGDGYAYMDGVGESKGAHAKHVQHLLNLTGYTLDPQNDQFGDAKWQAICGVCHYNATHETGDSAPANRHIEIDPAYQFGPNAPVYNGVPGTSSTVNFKSCSNVSCHFKDSPGWQDPATAGQ